MKAPSLMLMPAVLMPIVWLVICSILFLGTTGCDQEIKSRSNRHVLIFVDKTLSSDQQNQKLEEQKRDLRGLISNNLVMNGDRLQVCLLHESTDLASGVVSEKINLLLPDAEDELSRKRQESQYRIDLLNKQKQLLQKTITALTQQPNQSTSQWTNIWDSYEVIGRFAAQVPTTDTVVVVFVSDMLESMQGNNRRDFHKQSPASISQAEKWADADFGFISEELVRSKPTNPTNVQVQFWFPNEAGQHTNAKNVRAYWDRLFGKFGMTTASSI